MNCRQNVQFRLSILLCVVVEGVYIKSVSESLTSFNESFYHLCSECVYLISFWKQNL